MIVLELAVVVAYAATGVLHHRHQRRTLAALGTDELRRLAELNRDYVTARLESAEGLVEVLRGEAGRALRTPRALTSTEAAALALLPDGRYLTTRDHGGSALIASGAVPVGSEVKQVVRRSGALDPILAGLVEDHPFVVQAYFSSRLSVCRLYPYVDVTRYFEPGIRISDFNFYYEADATHNPEGGVVWTDAYLDPAGKGWIVSAIAPVYVDGTLEGVVGLDLTLAQVIDHVLELDVPWGGYATLVDEDGTAIALPGPGEADWGVIELGPHDYAAAVSEIVRKPDAFNLRERPDLLELSRAVRSAPEGAREIDLHGPRVLAWSSVPETGWKLLLLVQRKALFASVDERLLQTGQISLGLLAGMAVFFGAFFAWLYRRSRRLSLRLVDPLREIDALVGRIGRGEHRQAARGQAIEELDRTERGVVEMGIRMAEQVEALEATRAMLERAKSQAEAASRAKTHFIANMSHELRTPLNGVIGLAEQLAEAPLPPAHRDLARTILESGRGLASIVEDILDFSRLEQGPLDTCATGFEVRPFVDRLVAEVKTSAAERNLALESVVDPSTPQAVRGDAARLRRALLQLLQNAIKFTPSGGVTVRVTGGDGRLDVRIEDTGPGIPEAERERVFAPFVQGDDGFTRRHGGVGLGLALCRRVIEALGGTIHAEAAPGGGAALVVEIPAPPTDHLPGRPDPRRAARSLEVLVAEDNPVNALVVGKVLATLGHAVTRVENGRAAVEAVRSGRFDVVLMDIQMPEMDGLEATRAIRGLTTEARGTPIVALTAHATPEDRATGLAAGMDDYLTKPLDREELAAALARMVSVPD